MPDSFTEKKQKIGVFGGTFDPVHEGHFRLAEFVLGQGVVDHILFLPAAQPPHKLAATALFSHRMEMLETVIAGRPDMTASSLESRRRGPSYTVDSLVALRREFPQARLFFLLGADSLLELHLWYHFAELFDLAELIVVARSGLENERCYHAIKALPGFFFPDSVCRTWHRDDGARIWYLSGFSSSVSSSEVRSQLAAGQRPQGVDPAVLAYISRHNLYGIEKDHAIRC